MKTYTKPEIHSILILSDPIATSFGIDPDGESEEVFSKRKDQHDNNWDEEWEEDYEE